MPSISNEQPPQDTEPKLTEFLSRMFTQVSIAFKQVNFFIPNFVLPNKLQVGTVHYFGQAIPPDIVYAGFWGYTDSGWVYLGANNSVEAAYGGLAQFNNIPLPDINGDWQTIPYEAGMLVEPRRVIQDADNNTIDMQDEGVYRFGFTMSLRHDEKNNGRAINIRLRNPVSGVVSDVVSVGTGRDTDVTFFTTSSLVDTDETQGMGSSILVEMRADTSDAKEIYEDVILTESTFDVNQISEMG